MYLLVLLIPVGFAWTLAPRRHRRAVLLAGVAMVVIAGIVVGFDVGPVGFYVVSALPVILIVVSVYLRKSHKDKKLKKDIDF